jgi:hypothetical protein
MRIYSRDERSTEAPGIRIAERERPATLHHAMRATREADETRIDQHQSFDVDNVFNPTSLRAPPARNGFVQRWVSDGTNPTSDRAEQRNWFNKKRAGWQIRDPETIPQQLRHIFPSAKLHDGQACVRVAGMVLCELPMNVARERRHAVDNRIRHLSSAIPESLEELRKRERAGVGPLQIGDQSTTFRGRRAPNYVD